MPQQRNESLENISRNGTFDVIVLGGGINGIGVYRDLALQGLRVLLVEPNDFCSGCSAAPSRMIHGGLRYLENGEFALVRESLRERDILLANAPHLVKPLATTIPIRSLFSGLLNGAANFLGLSDTPTSRGALAVKAGLALYDWTTRRRRVLPRHAFRGARQTFAQWPNLDPKLRFSATYYDAWISFPERLGIELLLDTALLAPESVVLNYSELTRESDGYAIVDRQTGARLGVSATTIVNATGAWLDQSISQLGNGGQSTSQLVEGTKGSHLVLDCEPLHRALNGHMIFFENTDGRVCIAFPYLGKVLAGSTDIRVKQAERVRCEPEEIAYILDALGVVFPGIEVAASHVVYTYSGIRPLPKSDHAFTGRISRGHFVHRLDGDVPQFCMIGGKWTTFRAFAEQTADAVLAELGRPRLRHTIGMPIGGGAGFSGERDLIDDLVNTFAISRARAAHLIEAYGTDAHAVMEFCNGREDDTRLEEPAEITGAEILFLIKHEFVVSLSDVLQRRTALAIRGDISTYLIERVADILGRELRWDGGRQRAEVGKFIGELELYHGVSREMLDKRTKGRGLVCG